MATSIGLHTVAICTAGRVDMVAEGLAYLCEALAYPGRTLVLVVNNGPRADVAKLQAAARVAFAEGPPCWRVVDQPVPGLSHARNLALDMAEGEVVTFLDDDTRPCGAQWQQEILAVFTARPDVAVVGGPVIPVPPPGARQWPPWRSARTDRIWSCIERPASGYCGPAWVAGGNASYRRSAVGMLRFEARVGWNRSVALPLAGEETLFNAALEVRGHRSWFESGAGVLHRIEPQRYRPGWVLRRAFLLGRTGALFDRLWVGMPAGLVRRAAVGALGRSVWRGLGALCLGRVGGAFAHLCEGVGACGALALTGAVVADMAPAFPAVETSGDTDATRVTNAM